MARFKFNLFIIAITFMPIASAEVEISANSETNILFIEAGENITFIAKGLENTTSTLWDFGRDIEGPDTRYSNLTNLNHTVHASGRYNVTFTAFYSDDTIIKELIVIVSYEETYQEVVVHNEALFFAIAGTELIMSAILGYWTQQIRREKVYL
tara:strand:+ start:410 stop:868 length:459 start_codon:yes stop_codon:yes gene_type:complete